MRSFLDRLNDEVLVIGGSVEGFLRSRGILRKGVPSVLLNLDRPEEIIKIYRDYIEFGADVIFTNTSGAIRSVLSKYGAESDLEIINARAVEIAREASEGKVFIAGNIGTIGENVEPFGELPFDEAFNLFAEQIKVLIKVGVDILIIDSITEIQEARVAVIAANFYRGSTPLIVRGKFGNDGRMETGTSAEAFATILEGLDVNVLGVTCSSSSDQLLELVKDLVRYSNLPVSANLCIQDENSKMKLTSTDISSLSKTLVDSGAGIICGGSNSTPEDVKIIASVVKGKRVSRESVHNPTRISSRCDALNIGTGYPFVKIGERINPTGRKSLTRAISNGRTDVLVKEAKAQCENGAMALDINVSLPMVDEAAVMHDVVCAIQKAISVPLVLDSISGDVLEAGLKVCPGRSLVNSVNGEEEQIKCVLPLVKKYGAAVIALTMKGSIPGTAEERLKIAREIVAVCKDYGISEDSIIIDPIALAIATVQDSAQITLEAVRLVKSELGMATSLGVSNVSFGMPSRPLINNTFLVQAMAMGLDVAILNPMDRQVHNFIASASLFVGRDPYCKNFLKNYRSKKTL